MIENAASSAPIQSDACAAETCPSCMTSVGTTGTTMPKPSASSATVASTSPMEAERGGRVPAIGSRLGDMAADPREAALYKA